MTARRDALLHDVSRFNAGISLPPLNAQACGFFNGIAIQGNAVGRLFRAIHPLRLKKNRGRGRRTILSAGRLID